MLGLRAGTCGAGTTTVVDGEAGSSPGFANAGAIPPVSAVREMTTPDARTATTPRLEQNSIGARIVHSTPSGLKERRGSPPPPCAATKSPNAGLVGRNCRDASKPNECLGPDAPVSESSSSVRRRCYNGPAHEEAGDVDPRRRRALGVAAALILAACGSNRAWKRHVLSPTADHDHRSYLQRRRTAAAPAPPEAQAKNWFDLDVGDCLATSRRVDLGEVTVGGRRLCTTPSGGGLSSAPVEVNAAIADVADQQCAAAVSGYTGAAPAAVSFVVTYLIDSNQDRTSDNPLPSTVICLLQAGGRKTADRVRAPRRAVTTQRADGEGDTDDGDDRADDGPGGRVAHRAAAR